MDRVQIFVFLGAPRSRSAHLLHTPPLPGLCCCCCVRADEVLDVDAQPRLVVAVDSAGVERKTRRGCVGEEKGREEGGGRGGSGEW